MGALLLAVLFGGAVGFEREVKAKAAGLRTNILICVGATLFTQLSMRMTGATGDPSRIAAQIVTGVGFIGAGTILRARGGITGLTSAATIWVVAAIGVALGAGAVFEAAGVTLLLLVVLGGLGPVERFVHRRSLVSKLTVEVDQTEDGAAQVEELVRQKGLEVEVLETESLDHDRMRVQLSMRGPKRLHDRARLSVLRMTGSYKLSIDE